MSAQVICRLRMMMLVVQVAGAVAGGTPQPPARPVAAIEALIDSSQAESVIRVPPGRYVGNLVIRRPVVLDGGGRAIVDGAGQGTVIEIAAEHVTVRGFVIRGSAADVTGEPAGVRVLAAAATIESNIIDDVLFGIDLREAPGCIVRDNVITGKVLDPGRRGDGIRLWWSHDCRVEGNMAHGVRDMVFWYSERLLIARNTVTDSRYGLHFMYSHDTLLKDNDLSGNSVGVYLMYSNRITLDGNRMLRNRGASGYGIGLKDCDDVVVRGNGILANRVGVYVDNSPSSVGASGLFASNLIAFNEIGLLATPNTHDNVLTRNAFIENGESAATHGRGRLVANVFARAGVGNYWSDYVGFDLDGDGIGDLSHQPRSLFSAMLAREPNLRLFVHSPAQQAIDFTARALPELQPEPVLIDPAPLVDVPATVVPLPAAQRGSVWMAVTGAALALAGGGLGVALGRTAGFGVVPTGGGA